MGDVWEERERLPQPEKGWEYEHDGRLMAVAIAYLNWPRLIVSLYEHGSGLRTRGEFSDRGALARIEIEMFGGTEISAAVLRRPVIAALREWESVGREIARQILAGVPEDELVFDGKGAAGAMRILLGPAGAPRPPQRKRGQSHEDLVREVARAYREVVAAGDPAPLATIAGAFRYSRAHAARLVGEARRPRHGRPALLGPALRGRAGEAAIPAADGSPA